MVEIASLIQRVKFLKIQEINFIKKKTLYQLFFTAECLFIFNTGKFQMAILI